VDPYSYVSTEDAIRAARQGALDGLTRLEYVQATLAQENNYVSWFIEIARWLVESNARHEAWSRAIGVAECSGHLPAALGVARAARTVEDIEGDIHTDLRFGQVTPDYRPVWPLPHVRTLARAITAAIAQAPPDDLEWFYDNELLGLLSTCTMTRWQATRPNEITPTMALLRRNPKFRAARDGMLRCIFRLSTGSCPPEEFGKHRRRTAFREKNQITISILRERLDALDFTALRRSVMAIYNSETGTTMANKTAKKPVLAQTKQTFPVETLQPVAQYAELLVELIREHFPIDDKEWPNEFQSEDCVNIVLNEAIRLDRALQAMPPPYGIWQGAIVALEKLKKCHDGVLKCYGWTERVRGTATTWNWEWPAVPRIADVLLDTIERSASTLAKTVEGYAARKAEQIAKKPKSKVAMAIDLLPLHFHEGWREIDYAKAVGCTPSNLSQNERWQNAVAAYVRCSEMYVNASASKRRRFSST
jgi:hypothetical protein